MSFKYIKMVSVIDENFEYFECFDGEDAISTEIKIYLSSIGLGTGPPLEPHIPIIINE